MKKILVIGAGDYQTPLIKRIKELGYEAYCVDRNESAVGFAFADGHKTIDVCDSEKCLDYAKELGIDGVMTYGATLTLPTVAYIGRALNLPALCEETAEISKSKYAIKRSLADCGLNIYGDFFELDDINKAKGHTFTYPCVIKPSDGSGSKGVSIVRSQEGLWDALDFAFKSARFGKVYVESFVEGEEYSVEAFADGDDVYIYAIVKSTFIRKENGDISYGHSTPSGLSQEVEDLISNEVKKAIRALNITMGSVNFDVILSKSDLKPYIIDVGIRVGQNLIGSHLVPLSRGINVMDSAILLALGEHPKLKPTRKDCVATRLLIYNPGIIREIKATDELIGTNNIVAIVMRKSIGDRLNPYKEKSDTCGWVIAKGESPAQAQQNAEKAKDILKDYIIIE